MSARRPLGLACLVAALLGSATGSAHPVTVDGSPADWMTRLPNADNLGLVARDATGRGELIWRDAAADTRTDVSTPEVVADIVAFQVTGDAQNLSFLVRRQPGQTFTGSPIQLQVAIDLDRVAGSGQDFFAEFADTKVADSARWERLVETSFGSGGTAKVIDTAFNQVATVAAMVGVAGDVEIALPWTALGLSGPPTTPIRLTVAAFRAQSNDLTIDLGGGLSSNALDVVSNYGDPAASTYPNTFAEVQDGVVNYALDVWFSPTGEVIAPLVVQRFVSNGQAAGSDEWYALRNTTAAALPLAGFRLGDEETPDGSEGMFFLPAGATIAAGGTYFIARSGAAYAAHFGVAPDGELPPGSSAVVPDLTADASWTSAAVPNLQLANPGDELLVLDPAATLVDVVVYGNGVYAGIAPLLPAPGQDAVATRNAAASDSDDCAVDFADAGPQCISDAACGAPCSGCVLHACAPLASGTACADSDVCNGAETCNGAGVCISGSTLSCDDGTSCTSDACDGTSGCSNADLGDGTPCNDGPCDGSCLAGACDCGAGGGGGAGGGASGGGGAGGSASGGGGAGGSASGGGGAGGSASGGGGAGGSASGGGGAGPGGANVGGAPPANGGASANGGSGPSGGGAVGGGGGAGADDGCSCTTLAPDARDQDPGQALLALFAALVVSRRRRPSAGRST